MKEIVSMLVLAIFSLSASAAGIALDSQAIEYEPGDGIKLNYFKTGGLASGAWVGVFKSGFKSNEEHLTYQYIEGDAGSLLFSAPTEHGDYLFVLYGSGYEGDEHQRVKFSIAAKNSDSVALILDQNVYKPASSIKVDLKIKNRSSGKAWIGAFPQNAPHGVADGYLTYQYVEDDKRQSYIFRAPEQPGDYDFRFFDDDYGKEMTSVSFKVAAFDSNNLSLSTNKTEFSPQETIQVHFVADKDFPTDAWVGLYKGDVKKASNSTEHYLDYRYIEKKVESDMSFKAPAEKGDYHLKMVTSEHGDVVTMSGFSVNRTIDADLLKEQIDKQGRVVLYGIYFDLDKSKIKQASYPTLTAVKELLRKYPELSLQIEGHTDSQGGEDYNKQLSEKRAQSVKKYLVDSLSIASSRLTAIGYGEERPINNNASVAEQALNRRVEIVKMEPESADTTALSLSGLYGVDLSVFKDELEITIAKSMPKFKFHQQRVEMIVNDTPAREGSYTIDKKEGSRLIMEIGGRTLEAKLSEDLKQFYMIEGEQTPYIKLQ
jgi:outer membrane protein OmpA-like peptidoglycan-associated protein